MGVVFGKRRATLIFALFRPRWRASARPSRLRSSPSSRLCWRQVTSNGLSIAGLGKTIANITIIFVHPHYLPTFLTLTLTLTFPFPRRRGPREDRRARHDGPAAPTTDAAAAQPPTAAAGQAAAAWTPAAATTEAAASAAAAAAGETSACSAAAAVQGEAAAAGLPYAGEDDRLDYWSSAFLKPETMICIMLTRDVPGYSAPAARALHPAGELWAALGRSGRGAEAGRGRGAGRAAGIHTTTSGEGVL